MKSASKLLSIAFALATAVSVALPTAQPAEAASGPDIGVVFTGFVINQNGSVAVDYSLKNHGDKKSEVIVVHRFCGYLQPGSQLKEVFNGTPTVVPGLNPSALQGQPTFTCPKWEGQIAVAARVLVITSGDTNTANNQAKSLTFKL